MEVDGLNAVDDEVDVITEGVHGVGGYQAGEVGGVRVVRKPVGRKEKAAGGDLIGLNESGRPYLLVVRKDNRREGVELVEGENGMVVEWCSQTRVLSHPSVGCFVTHCGWNSTLESLACGVPTVAVPQMWDQRMNSWMAEAAWGTGISGELNVEGGLEGSELRRCLEVVMGEGEAGVEIRRRVEIWRDNAREAIKHGGPSDGNLRGFVEEAMRKATA